MDIKLEFVVVPVADVDRATDFCIRRVPAVRLPGPHPQRSSYGSFRSFRADHAAALGRAAAPHGEHETRTSAEDPNWPDWYADHMVRDQAGTNLPS
jgi:hypothetical protein